MLRKLFLAALLGASTLITATAGTATIDGTRGAAEGYLTATNAAAGIDSNVNEGFGASAKAEQINAQDDANNLYVMVEGSLYDNNRLFVLIDSDGQTATGVTRIPTGTYGESTALNYFDPNVAGGGWDTIIMVQGRNGVPTPTSIGGVVLTYNSNGSLAEESFTANSANLTFNESDTLRGNTANLQITITPGDGPGDGIELAIPKAWLLNQASTGNYRLATINGNGANDYWSNSTIPQNSFGSNIGNDGSVGSRGALATLTAPIFTWQVAATNPSVVLTTTYGSPTNLASVPVTATFSTAVTGFVQADITSVTNCTVSGFAGSGAVYTFNVNPTAPGTFSVRIPGAVANATVGGAANSPSAPLSLVYDNAGPNAVVLTSTAPNPTGANPILVQARFSEAVTGFVAGDITPTNATVTGLTSVTAQTWRFSLIPSGNGVVGASIAAGAVTDVAGNASTAGANITRTFNSANVDVISQYNGQTIFATGASPLDGFNPGSNPFLQLRDDGTLGDVTAGDGIFSVDVTPDSGNGTDRRQWKVSTAGFSYTFPGGLDNSYWRPLANQTTKLIFDTRDLNDGYTPEAGPTVAGVLYTTPNVYTVSDVFRATGSFLSEISGNDWDASNNAGLLADGGVNGDATAGDGIFTLQFANIPVGQYAFKVTFNGSFDGAIGANGGFRDGGDGGDISFSTFSTTDTVQILFDARRGAFKVVNSNPLANPGPPFFATSDAWSTSLTLATQLNDAGTDGDVTAGDGIYARTFAVANVSTTHSVKVRQYVGPAYPNTGNGYPFITTFPGQLVLVQFDTNVRGDGFVPSTRYVWTDGNSRRVPPYVQAVGNFQNDFSSGLINNFDSNAAAFQLLDDGASGDGSAGDRIYAKAFGNLARPNSEFKAVGAAGNFTYQFGGEGDGYTYNGNNATPMFNFPANVTLVTDAVTGRVGINGLPTRPASLNALPEAPNAAKGWMMFE